MIPLLPTVFQRCEGVWLRFLVKVLDLNLLLSHVWRRCWEQPAECQRPIDERLPRIG
jgi:hypothetical protein